MTETIQAGTVTVNPDTRIGKNQFGFSMILKNARGIQAARLLDLARKAKLIRRVMS